MKSLRARVLWGAGFVLAVFLVLTAAALDRAFYESAMAAEHERLLGQVYLLMGSVEVSDDGAFTLTPEIPVPRLQQPESGLYAYVLDERGAILWSSPSTVGRPHPKIAPVESGKTFFGRHADADRHGRNFIQTFGVNWDTGRAVRQFTFAVLADPAAFMAQITAFRHALWGWLGGMSLALLVAQGFILHWGLRPLRQVVRELRAIEAATKDQIGGRYPLEIQRLTDPINALLHQERARIVRYRDGLADLAHSLKTPLAVLRSSLEGERNPDQLARVLDEQVSRMGGIVEHQLQRAMMAGRSSARRRFAVRPVADRLLDALQKVYREKGVRVQVDSEPGLEVWLDEGDLTELLGNLLDNAFKWCRREVRLVIGLEGRDLCFVIEDDGPGIEPDRVEAMLARGARADESVPGHGIGLSMVREMVKAYEGGLAIDRSGLGGAAVRIRLPL